MESTEEKPVHLLLHACCGPCSLEPVRLLRQRGIEPHIHYANSNIAPADEYARRRDTIRAWATEIGLSFAEGTYAPDETEAAAEREKRAAAREAEKARRAAAREPEERRLAARRAQRAAYDAKQAHKRAVLKALRAHRKEHPDA